MLAAPCRQLCLSSACCRAVVSIQICHLAVCSDGARPRCAGGRQKTSRKHPKGSQILGKGEVGGEPWEQRRWRWHGLVAEQRLGCFMEGCVAAFGEQSALWWHAACQAAALEGADS